MSRSKSTIRFLKDILNCQVFFLFNQSVWPSCWNIVRIMMQGLCLKRELLYCEIGAMFWSVLEEKCPQEDFSFPQSEQKHVVHLVNEPLHQLHPRNWWIISSCCHISVCWESLLKRILWLMLFFFFFSLKYLNIGILVLLHKFRIEIGSFSYLLVYLLRLRWSLYLNALLG